VEFRDTPRGGRERKWGGAGRREREKPVGGNISPLGRFYTTGGGGARLSESRPGWKGGKQRSAGVYGAKAGQMGPHASRFELKRDEWSSLRPRSRGTQEGGRHRGPGRVQGAGWWGRGARGRPSKKEEFNGDKLSGSPAKGAESSSRGCGNQRRFLWGGVRKGPRSGPTGPRARGFSDHERGLEGCCGRTGNLVNTKGRGGGGRTTVFPSRGFLAGNQGRGAISPGGLRQARMCRHHQIAREGGTCNFFSGFGAGGGGVGGHPGG